MLLLPSCIFCFFFSFPFPFRGEGVCAIARISLWGEQSCFSLLDTLSLRGIGGCVRGWLGWAWGVSPGRGTLVVHGIGIGEYGRRAGDWTCTCTCTWKWKWKWRDRFPCDSLRLYPRFVSFPCDCGGEEICIDRRDPIPGMPHGKWDMDMWSVPAPRARIDMMDGAMTSGPSPMDGGSLGRRTSGGSAVETETETGT